MRQPSLLSMRAGAVGINLTAASHVFLLEPCLNPALEDQAIGRAWRMGQTRTVTVKRARIDVPVAQGHMATMRGTKIGRGRWELTITIAEGKNREIRRLCEALELQVDRLVRVKFGPVELGDLPAGKVRSLTRAEVKALEKV